MKTIKLVSIDGKNSKYYFNTSKDYKLHDILSITRSPTSLQRIMKIVEVFDKQYNYIENVDLNAENNMNLSTHKTSKSRYPIFNIDTYFRIEILSNSLHNKNL